MDNPSAVVLAHYGVKGMKWGVRRKKSDSGSSSKSSTPKKSVTSRVVDATNKYLDDRDNSINTARSKIAGAKANTKAARQEARAARRADGWRSEGAKAARKALRQAREEKVSIEIANNQTARMSTSKELTNQFMFDMGSMLVSSIVKVPIR